MPGSGLTTPQLVDLVRLKLDDQVEPYRVADADIIDALAYAQDQFARLTLVAYGVEPDQAITAGEPWLEIPDRMLVLKALIHNGKQVRPVLVYELDLGYASLPGGGPQNAGHFSNWREATGEPRFCVTDMKPNHVRLVPTPDENGVVDVEGYVVPPMLDATTDPVLPEAYRAYLAHGALVRLYDVDDLDVGDQDQKIKAMTEWRTAIKEAQVHLNTGLRTMVRKMRLPRGFEYGRLGDLEGTHQAAAVPPLPQ